jgi:hypothetical protein
MLGAQRLLLLAAGFCASVCAAAEPTLDSGYAHMYNLDFAEAHRTFGAWMAANPQDPMGPVSDAAAYLFSELDRLRILEGEFFLHDDNFRSRQRLTADASVARSFQQQLTKADLLGDQWLAREPRNTNALFAKVLVLGLRSDYDGLIEKRYLSSLSATKKSRGLAEALLAIDPSFHDAWLAIGVENYLLSLKPAPVRWVLQLAGNATDRELGLEKLRITAEKGRYLKPFAQLLLAVAALRDKNHDQAKEILRGLAQQFPRNRLYAQELSRLK